MTDSVYRKTPLPARLNLSDRNTREQLQSGSHTEDKRGSLEGVGLARVGTAAQSQQDCTDVMRQDLAAWLAKHGIEGPPPSQEAEGRAMWQWIRDFHKEYNDDWFTRNMPRLHERFKPVFVEKMKAMKALLDSKQPPAGPNLLDMDAAEDRGVQAQPAEAPGDLLSLDLGGQPQPAPAPSTASALPGLTPDALAPSGGGGLLDLDLGSAQPPASAAPYRTDALQAPLMSLLDPSPALVVTGQVQQPIKPAQGEASLLDLL